MLKTSILSCIFFTITMCSSAEQHNLPDRELIELLQNKQQQENQYTDEYITALYKKFKAVMVSLATSFNLEMRSGPGVFETLMEELD